MRKRIFFILVLFTWINMLCFYKTVEFDINQTSYEMENMAAVLFVPIVYATSIFLKILGNLFCLWIGLSGRQQQEPRLSLFLFQRKAGVLRNTLSLLGVLGIIFFAMVGLFLVSRHNYMGIGYAGTRMVSIVLYVIWIKSIM